MLDLPSLIPLLSQTLEPPSRTRLPAKDHKRPSDSPRKSRSVSVPSSSSSSPSSRVTSHSPPPTTRFDWGNDRHCVQFLLLSWLDLIVPQTAQPSPEGVCLGKIIKFLSLQVRIESGAGVGLERDDTAESRSSGTRFFKEYIFGLFLAPLSSS